METSKEKLGRILKQSRIILRLKQNKMAKLFKIDPATLCRYENGDETPYGDRLLEMLEVLAKSGINLNTMFDERMFSNVKSV